MGQDQSKRFTLPTGATLVVTTSSFQDAYGLTKAVLRTVKGVSISPTDLKRDFKSVGEAAMLIPAFLDKLISFATSDEVEACVFKCAQRALYIPAGSPEEVPGVKVDRALFDDAVLQDAAREDYAQIMLRIVEVNCKPFLAKALSGLLTAAPEAAAASSSPK